jgi:hypothetical protein
LFYSVGVCPNEALTTQRRRIAMHGSYLQGSTIRWLRGCSPAALTGLLLVGPATPWRGLAAQAFDSTGMPSLELLAMEAGRASRIHPIRAVARSLLCEASHPFVDSASLAACTVLTTTARAAAITAAFARGIEVPLDDAAGGESSAAFPTCPPDLDRAGAPRVLVARIAPPVVGVYEGRWEGRLTVELRCRSPGRAGGDEIRISGKEYLYQWSGRAWQMYQHSWLRAGR